MIVAVQAEAARSAEARSGAEEQSFKMDKTIKYILEDYIIPGIFILTILGGFVAGVYYFDRIADEECLTEYAKQVCVSRNMTFFNIGMNNEIRCIPDERSRIATEFIFLEEELNSCTIKKRQSFIRTSIQGDKNG